MLNRMRQLLGPNSFPADPPRNKSLELRILQSYILALRVPQDTDGYKTSPLADYGPYEVRLIEPSQLTDTKPFWIELFDHDRKTTINSFGTDDLEAAANAAGTLIGEAETLCRQAKHRR